MRWLVAGGVGKGVEDRAVGSQARDVADDVVGHLLYFRRPTHGDGALEETAHAVVFEEISVDVFDVAEPVVGVGAGVPVGTADARGGDAVGALEAVAGGGEGLGDAVGMIHGVEHAAELVGQLGGEAFDLGEEPVGVSEVDCAIGHGVPIAQSDLGPLIE